MKQDRLNNCLQMRCHKSITDTLDTVKIAMKFVCANEQRKGHLRKFERGYTHGWLKNEPPHVSKRTTASGMADGIRIRFVQMATKLQVMTTAQLTFSDVTMFYGVNQCITPFQANGREIYNRRHAANDIKNQVKIIQWTLKGICYRYINP